MNSAPRDRDERLLALAVSGLPSTRAEWGRAMRAELASIDEPDARQRFARSAARIAFVSGFGIRIGLPLLAGLLVAAIVVVASRVQLAEGGPGLLSVTVPIPALVIMLVAAVATVVARSSLVGLATGFLAMAASAVAVFAVLAIEGIAWMDLRGVYSLDGDPPLGPVTASDVAFNVVTTGMWVGHVALWAPAVLVGAAVGGWIVRARHRLGVRAPS